MAVCRVFAQAYVGHDQKFGHILFQRANCFLNDSVGRVGARGKQIFFLGVRYPKQENPGNSEVANFFCFLDQFIDGKMIVAWDRIDFVLYAVAGHHEQRQDQIVNRQ